MERFLTFLSLSYWSVGQIRSLLTDSAGKKLLVLSGQTSEQTGDIILQSGVFTCTHFTDIIADPEVKEKC